MPELLYPEAWDQFAHDLEQAGFDRLAPTDGKWEGNLYVDWDDQETGKLCEANYRISIELNPGFPFKKPDVTPLDELQVARHRAPVSQGGALCLYSDRRNGWSAANTAQDLLDRTRDWFRHHNRDDWDDWDRPPDLHLYYPRTHRRHIAVTAEDWHPPDGLSGRFALWEGIQSILVTSPSVGSTMPAARRPERLAKALGVSEASGVGLWFRLAAEPTPADNLKEVLADIDLKTGSPSGFARSIMRGLAGVRPRKEFRTILAVGYPGVDGEDRWLFLDVILPVGKTRAKRWESSLSEIKVRSYEAAPATETDLCRRVGDAQAQLKNKQVLIFGLGAVGSTVAVLLAKAGIGSLSGVDGDQLRPGNCIRHEAGLRLTGFDKGTALSLLIDQFAPHCSFTVHRQTWEPSSLSEMIGKADLVVDATANETFGLLLNEVCLGRKTPLVAVATYRRASVGRVRLVKPRDSACQVCYLKYMTEANYPLIPPGEEGEFIEGGCGDPTVEASALDIEFVANVATRTIRDVLTGAACAGDECLVVVSPLLDGEPPLNKAGIHWMTRSPVDNCGACGQP